MGLVHRDHCDKDDDKDEGEEAEEEERTLRVSHHHHQLHQHRDTKERQQHKNKQQHWPGPNIPLPHALSFTGVVENLDEDNASLKTITPVLTPQHNQQQQQPPAVQEGNHRETAQVEGEDDETTQRPRLLISTQHQASLNAASTSSPSSSSPSFARSPSFKEPLSILLVDDALSILKMTSMVLRKQSHTVTTAENGQEAVDSVRERRFDLVIMDLQMPVMDGFEAMRRIRAMECAPTDEELSSSSVIPTPSDGVVGPASASRATSRQNSSALHSSQGSVATVRIDGHTHRHVIIAVSANDRTQYEIDALAAGADIFLPKPVKVQDIHDAYQRVKAQQQQQQETLRSEQQQE